MTKKTYNLHIVLHNWCILPLCSGKGEAFFILFSNEMPKKGKILQTWLAFSHLNQTTEQDHFTFHRIIQSLPKEQNGQSFSTLMFGLQRSQDRA